MAGEQPNRGSPAGDGPSGIVPLPEIEVLWCAACPSTERALSVLREALQELSLGGAEVRLVEIRTEAQARARGFAGSPTILIDGSDPVAQPPAQAPGEGACDWLSCRIYRLRDGRLSPVPDPQDVRDALAGAVARRRASVS